MNSLSVKAGNWARLRRVWQGYHPAEVLGTASERLAGGLGGAKCHLYALRPSEGLLCYSCGGIAVENTVRMR